MHLRHGDRHGPAGALGERGCLQARVSTGFSHGRCLPRRLRDPVTAPCVGDQGGEGVGVDESRPRRQLVVLTCYGAAGGALAIVLGLAAQHFGTSVALPAGCVFGAVLGLVAAPPLRLRLERRSEGAQGLLSLVLACMCLAGLMSVLGVGALYPAAAVSAAAFSCLLEPTKRRLAACAVVVLVTSAACLGIQWLGWVEGVFPTPVAALTAAVLVVLSAPTLVHTCEAARRAQQATREREAERAEYLEVLQQAAMHDSLTGLLGRRGLAEPLSSAATSAEPGALSAVVLLDLDGFKPINDVYGHTAGDLVLVEVARRLRACVREGGAVARTGGDEFVIVLHGLADSKAAELVARRIRTALAEEIELADGSRVTVGASIGVVSVSAPSDADDLLAAADMAMYQEKRSSRPPHERVQQRSRS